MPRKGYFIIGTLGILLLMAAATLGIPDLRERAAWHLSDWRGRIQYALFPPEEAVFVPQAQVDAIVHATLQAMTPSPSPTPTEPAPTIEPGETASTSEPTATPTPTPTPLPSSVSLEGVVYHDQHGMWNYCAPANLAMGLSYWGWQGDRVTVGEVIKPFEKDKNVMLYEMADYVTRYTNLTAAVRHGGDLQTLKTLLANGYPVLVETGPMMKDVYGKISWIGHYTVLTGYDDAKGQFISQDSFYQPDYPIPYEQFEQEWRSFNYQFMVIFPYPQESEVMALLGPLADPIAAFETAAERASREIAELEGLGQFFAWFNRGTSLVNLGDFTGAAAAYDQAFLLMAELPSSQRPWRILWYQTGPYFAYYFSGRYQDVINLADTTISAVAEPYIEESFVWRARAKIVLGDYTGAAEDTRKALEYHPGFDPALELATQLGIGG